LQLERKIFRPEQFGKMAVAALLIATFLASLLLAASPSLHEHWHKDASNPAHQCAITTFQQQQLTASNPAVIVVELNFGLVLPVSLTDLSAFSDHNYRFSASRAPPFILSPLA